MGTGKAILVVVCVLQLTFCMAALNSAAAAAPPAAGNNDIAQTVKALKEIKIPDDGSQFYFDVPPGAGPLLTRLKHHLRDLIIETLTSHDGSLGPTEVERAVAKELRRQGITVRKQKTTDYDFGGVYPVRVRTVRGHTGLIAATTEVGLSNQVTDTSLYVFKRRGRRWDLALVVEADGYRTISGGQNHFGYHISPPVQAGKYFIVVKDLASGCVGGWEAIRYRVLIPTADAYKPKVVLNRLEGILVTQGTGTLTPLPGGFRLEYYIKQKLGDPAEIRRHIEAYRVVDDRVERVAPLSDEPAGFLDEWADLEWKEALQWVEPAARSKVRLWHEAFRRERDEATTRSFFLYPSMLPEACATGRGRWQIGFVLEPYSKAASLPSGIPERLYFNIVMKKGVYYVRDVSEKIAEKCRATVAW